VVANLNKENDYEGPLALPGFEHINRYWDKQHEKHAAKILPGEFYVTRHDEIIVTVLGSCISACVRDPITGIGGMNHFMLPVSAQLEADVNNSLGLSTRYGNYAMEHLINEILKYGGLRKNLEVKIFGGGKILAQMTDVGEKNMQFVRAFIHTEGLNLLSEDLGDIYPRKVHYYPKSGKVRVRKLRSLHNDTIGARERAYMRQIEAEQSQSDIELF
jgi:chemotaxis protein CheD